MVALTLATVALLACAVPARRAARVDPLTALADAWQARSSLVLTTRAPLVAQAFQACHLARGQP